MLETKTFSLEGRAIRKIRQSVNRLENAGYTARAEELASLDTATLTELERVSRLWRAGAAERGFSMAMDSLQGEYQADSIVVWACDESGAVKGFLHFVPSFGRSAMSLSFMRRERNAPNGLTEFLIVKSVELLGGRGIEELSLNFAAFGRLLERPRGRLEQNIEAAVPRDANLVIYCSNGNRSALAAVTLRDMGYEHVSSMSVGINGWTAIGGDVE